MFEINLDEKLKNTRTDSLLTIQRLLREYLGIDIIQ